MHCFLPPLSHFKSFIIGVTYFIPLVSLGQITTDVQHSSDVVNVEAPATLGSANWYFNFLPREAPSDPNSPAAELYAGTTPAVGRDDLWVDFPHRVNLAQTCSSTAQPEGDIAIQVAELARSHQVVIVNEAHDFPWHRKLTESLLGPLWDQGYRYLAAEAFSEQIDDYPDEAFGRIDAGVYASEPTFGSMIRTAKELGYELVPYGTPSEESVGTLDEIIARREEGQANHLMERIFDRDPSAKVVIHVGYSHAAEAPIPSGSDSTRAWMASRLKDKSGIDPLTIDQTYCETEGETPLFAGPAPQVPSGTFDLEIAYPQISTIQGRATWRLEPGKQLVSLPDQAIPTAGRAIVEARHANEPDAAIPVDRLFIRADESIPLVLPPGEFRLSVYTEGSSERKEFHIVVD